MSKTTIPTGGITADAINSTLIADDAISEEHLDATAITGHTALAESPADTDEFLISDGGTLKRIDASYIGGGSWTLLETETITGSTPSTVDISSFDSSYNIHAVLFDNVGSSNDNNQLRHAFSQDSGSNFNVQIYGGGFGHKVDESQSTSEDNFGSAAAGFVKIAEGVGSGSNEGLSGLIYYTGLKDTNRSTFYWGNTMVHTDNNKYTNYVLMGRCGTSDIDAIRYNFNAGTFDMGIIKLFGLK